MRFLVVGVDEPEWSLQVEVPRVARDRGHPLADELEVAIDRRLALPFRGRLSEFDAVLLQVQDPLGPLYPRVYEYTLALERSCDEAGVPLIGRAEPLSRTCKSRQLQILRRAGLRAPRAVRLGHWRDALSGELPPYPFVLRYDCGHASRDEGFAGPFRSPQELLRAGLPERGAWPSRRGLAGLGAVEYVETREPDGLYRKYKSFVFGETVVPGIFSVVREWFVHQTLEPEKSRYRDDVLRHFHGEIDPQLRELCLAAARATGFDLAAVDYSYLPDGGLVVFESNPFPAMTGWWSDDPVWQERMLDALRRLLERTAACGSAGGEERDGLGRQTLAAAREPEAVGRGRPHCDS